MKKWKVGIVGLSRGKPFVQVFSGHERIEVAALCDINPQTLADVGKAFKLADRQLFTDFDAFLGAGIDIVMVATPIREHASQTIKSLEAGKHVLCEQTAAYTLKDCEAIVNAVKKSGKTYMMAENYSYFYYAQEWKRRVQAGEIGDVYYAEGEYLHGIQNLLRNEQTGQYYWRHDRPPIWYCAHTSGPILTILDDDRIVKACGSAAGFRTRPDQKDHIGFLDMEIGLFRTEKNRLIKILRSQVVQRTMVWYSLYGTKGYIENGRLDGGQTLLHIAGNTHDDSRDEVIPLPLSDPNAPKGADAGGHGTSEYYMIRDFLDAIEQGRRPPIDVMRSMDMTVPGLIAHESAMSDGNWRDVPLFNW